MSFDEAVRFWTTNVGGSTDVAKNEVVKASMFPCTAIIYWLGTEGIVALRFTPEGARLVTTGYLAFVDADGLWQQKGVIRFWRVADGALRRMYDARTGIGVTSGVAWSPDGARFAYGTYEGTAVVAYTPAP